MKESARIDKWLWAARIYKTRSIAADACKNGRVMVGGVTRKPSFIIKRGDVVSVKKAPITYSFEVLAPLPSLCSILEPKEPQPPLLLLRSLTSLKCRV